MRVFQDRRGKAAIIVDEPDAICMPMETLTTDFGVCVRVTGRFGSIFLCSVYCQFDTDLAPYLRYLDAVLLLGSRTPVIFGLDANAVSPAWFSKLSGHNRGQANYARGELLSAWITEMRAGVLNEASRVFTFDNRRGQSYIDVTIVNQAATMWATYEWEVKEWDTSDHNMIHVVVTTDPNDTVEPIAPMPSWKLSNARWRLFEEEVVREIAELPEDIAESPLDNQVSALRSVVHIGHYTLQTPRGQETEAKAPGRSSARDRRSRGTCARVEDLLSAVQEAHPEIEEDNWRRFVGENRDDPWGHVYWICRGRKKSTEIGCLRTDSRLVATWRDCAGVLLRNFFPVAESNAHIAIPIEAPPDLEAFEVDACVARLKSRRSPGMDGITGATCKALLRAIPQHMTAMYSRCLETGYFPTEWKHHRVVPLLKGPDKDRTDPT
ncbi:GL21431 [Drosophila persimilis]|uniref:GL21431 n=1 Tax=Drosophila persimilis TaxID=7234 RepID=B4HCA8_DROPE|nr:GL21431 [Drosophila persimilis]